MYDATAVRSETAAAKIGSDLKHLNAVTAANVSSQISGTSHRLAKAELNYESLPTATTIDWSRCVVCLSAVSSVPKDDENHI